MSNEVRVPPSFAHSSSHPSPSADDCCEGMQPLRNRDRCDQRMVRGCFAPLVSLSAALTDHFPLVQDVKTEGEKLVEEGGLATQRLDGAFLLSLCFSVSVRVSV